MSFSEETLMALAARSDISKLLVQYADEPHDPMLNFILGLAYDNIGQTAAAVGFYLRAAEKSDDVLLRYEALIRCSNCFDTQGSRNYTTRGLLQHAVSLIPGRPEACYLMSRFHERNGEWQEAYMMASIGTSIVDNEHAPLRTDVGYPGKYAMLFQLAVPAWWVGLCQQAREILEDLNNNYEMDELHTRVVRQNLVTIGHPISSTSYYADLASKFKFPFPDLAEISKNYSQSYQDMFVLALLGGKKNGTYLEVGSGDPFFNNNTILLEKHFEWKGISVDNDRELVNKFFKERNNMVFCLDATQADYGMLLSMSALGHDIDYLQMDIDPPTLTLEALKKIPFDTHRFAVITYEHDAYRDVYEKESTREEARAYLKEKGYVLVVSNVGLNDKDSYEDWWAHPDLVDPIILKQMTDDRECTKLCSSYFLN
jgi:hypothetical protein